MLFLSFYNRAPTPTAAAEIAVPSRLDLLQHISQWQNRLLLSTTHQLKQKVLRLQTMVLTSPQKVVENWMMRLEDLSLRLEKNMSQKIDNKRAQLERFSKEGLILRMRHIIERKKQQWTLQSSLLEQSSLDKTLQRGFCIPMLSNGAVASFSSLHSNDDIQLKFHEGIKSAKII